jgi:two-component system OmpR family sensor kinase
VKRLGRLTVRWRLALISAGLTFAILLLFAVVIGMFTAQQIRSDFDDDLRIAAADLQERIGVDQTAIGPRLFARGGDMLEGAEAGEAAIRLIRPDGQVVFPPDAPDLGPARNGVSDVGDYRVVSRPIFVEASPEPIAYVQYGKPRERITHSLNRLKLFLFVGVMGGTALALFAGLALARRAMAPIAGLTGAAQSIARTRDPSVKLPEQKADDEVADLARTLEEMLAALGQARGETQAALERQREFVADASHELRTPLTSVLANLEILEQELSGDEREMASSALRSSHRMRRLVADLLLLARADAERSTDARKPVDLAGIVRESIGETETLSAGHQLTLSVPTPMEPQAVVEGVPDELHRLSLNLIENALAHTPPGTRVDVSVHRDGDTAVLEVADTGPGIPAEMRTRVFERFVRGSGGRRAGGSGSGLGLSIVRAVAESHGGSVALDDAPHGGARFTIRFPLAGVPAAPALAPTPASARQPTTSTG